MRLKKPISLSIMIKQYCERRTCLLSMAGVVRCHYFYRDLTPYELARPDVSIDLIRFTVFAGATQSNWFYYPETDRLERRCGWTVGSLSEAEVRELLVEAL